MRELAKLLGTTKEKLETLAEEMGEFTGKLEVISSLEEKVRAEAAQAVRGLGLSEDSPPHEIVLKLREHVEATERGLISLLGEVDCRTQKGCSPLIDEAVKLANPPKGFFLKEEKARELLLANPPQNVMAVLGYSDAQELLEKEDLFEVFASLRFAEEKKWLNEVFFTPYAKLTPHDFEEREVTVRVLEAHKWERLATAFMKKKFHNVSHLKEMGLVFTIPVASEDGITLRLFALLLHYLHEVPFYATYFKLVADKQEDGKGFADTVVSALRGDVRSAVPPGENLLFWLIIQQYLYKTDPDDFRLTWPHISPEALHWKKAAENLAKLGEERPELGLGFWCGRSHVGGILGNSLVSFNFEDNVFSAVPGQDVEQYTYHLREALWNQLFVDYFDGDWKSFEDLMIEDFAQGFTVFKVRKTLGE
jgi:hypothetical protein